MPGGGPPEGERTGRRRLQEDAKPRDPRETGMTGNARNRRFGDRVRQAAPAGAEGSRLPVTDAVFQPDLMTSGCYASG
ncbi:hypothetical protein GCM10010359_18540 [Streptomyces morookaense]|nr:hypothetical protein GCM10010359_18540 [Streptomyces morookaense]